MAYSLFTLPSLGVPPGGWKYDLETEPGVLFETTEGGHLTVTGRDFSEICVNVSEAWRNTGIDLNHALIPKLIHTQLCLRLGLNCIDAEGQYRYPLMEGRKITISDIWRGTMNILSNRVKTVKDLICDTETAYVKPEEAEKRAAICATCKLNHDYPDCTLPCQVRSALSNLRGTRKTSFDKELYACSVCQCDLKLLVHFPLSDLKMNPVDKLKLPAHCWKK